MTDNIDWQSQPEATHYVRPIADFCGGLVKNINGKWCQWLEHSESWHECYCQENVTDDRLIPRPAQYRNWDDPAMWFDAPEWAVDVVKWGGHYLYSVVDEGGNTTLETVGGISISIPYDNNWEVIATRPTKQGKDPLDELQEPLTGFLPIGDYCDHQKAIEALRTQAEALNRAADYLESLQ